MHLTLPKSPFAEFAKTSLAKPAYLLSVQNYFA